VAGDEESGLKIFWVYGNVFTQIYHRQIATHQNRQVYQLANRLHTLITANAKPKEDVRVPRILEIRGPEAPIMVGQTFNVNVSVEGPFNCEVKAKSGVR
jgi:hypothetical protein